MYNARTDTLFRGAGLPREQQPRCHACVDLEERFLKTISPYNSVRISAIETGSLKDCQGCAMLLEAVKSFLDDLQEPLVIQLNTRETLRLAVVPGNLDDQSSVEDRKPIQLEIFSLPGFPSRWDIVKPATIVPCHGSSSETSDFIKRHLLSCTVSDPTHSACAYFRDATLPTRVLRVGNDDNQPCLYESNGESSRYIALSHYWGGTSPLITTRATLAERKRRILVSELPRTFQDAVTVTRKLGIEYLWIDSLCIVQDSPEDWAKESIKMGTIYANSWATIAADAAKDSTSGFLDPQERLTKVVEIPCKSADGASTRLYFRECGEYANRERTEVTEFGYQNAYPLDNAEVTHRRKQRYRSRLSTRAWVLQERLLSPRTIHFSLEETAYECKSGTWCECSISKRPAASRIGRQHFKDLTHDQWNWIVLEFTRLNLTHDTDRLPALSGLASLHQAQIAASAENSEYLGGLWKKDLAKGLLWRVCTDDGISKLNSQRLTKYCAPSWSWASVTGTVHWETSYEISTSFRILHSEYIPDGPNPFGIARSGYIKVDAFVAPVRLEADRTVTLPRGQDLQADNPINVVSVQGLTESSPPTTIFHPDVCGSTIEVSSAEEYHFLLMAEGDPSIGNELAPIGLILKSAPNAPLVFSRVGFAWTIIEPEQYQGSQQNEDEFDYELDKHLKASAYRKSWLMWTAVASRQTLTII